MIDSFTDEGPVPPMQSRAWLFLAIRLLADHVPNRHGERIVAFMRPPMGAQ